MADVKAITLARLRKLVSRSDCAYLYNNGDVAFATTTPIRSIGS
jgi:hypothetical protein